jgi:predicted  nucleic acid-binding Zn-ribbon protein
MKKLNEQDLLRLKREVEEAKTKVAELTGQKNSLMKRLSDEWKCTTIEQAEKKLDSIDREIEQLKSKKEELVNKLEQEYF